MRALISLEILSFDGMRRVQETDVLRHEYYLFRGPVRMCPKCENLSNGFCKLMKLAVSKIYLPHVKSPDEFDLFLTYLYLFSDPVLLWYERNYY